MDNVTQQNGTTTQESIPSVIVVYSLVVVCSCIGLIGNIFVFKYLRTKHYQSATSLLLMFVTVYDEVTLSFKLLSTMAYLSLQMFRAMAVSSAPIASEAAVSVLLYVLLMPKFCGNVLLLIIAVERLYCVVKPHKVKAVFTRQVGKRLHMGVLMVVPLLICVAGVYNGTQIQTHGEYTHDMIVLRIVLLTVFFFIPTAGVLICNVSLIGVLLYRYIRKQQTVSRSRSYELKTTKLIFVVTTMFIICVTPQNCRSLLAQRTYDEMREETVLGSVYIFLQTVNYAGNIFVFYFGSSEFRKFCRIKFSRGRVMPHSDSNSIPMTMSPMRDIGEPRQASIIEDPPERQDHCGVKLKEIRVVSRHKESSRIWEAPGFELMPGAVMAKANVANENASSSEKGDSKNMYSEKEPGSIDSPC